MQQMQRCLIKYSATQDHRILIYHYISLKCNEKAENNRITHIVYKLESVD